jgi:nicotinamidase-related amidase
LDHAIKEPLYMDYIIDFTSTFEIEPLSTSLIIVDMQYATACRETGLGKLLERQGKGDLGKYRFDRIEKTVVPTIQRMLSFFREHELAVVYITMGSYDQYFSDTLPYLTNFFRSTNNRIGSKEHEILEELKPEPDELVINKTTMGAFSSTNLDSVLWSKGIKYLLFTGVSTNMCVETTARDAADRGFRCILIEDACGAPRPEYHEAALKNYRRLFGKVQRSEEILEMLASKIE